MSDSLNGLWTWPTGSCRQRKRQSAWTSALKQLIMMPPTSQRNTTMRYIVEMFLRWDTTCRPESSETDRKRSETEPTGNSVVVGILAGRRMQLLIQITCRIVPGFRARNRARSFSERDLVAEIVVPSRQSLTGPCRVTETTRLRMTETMSLRRQTVRLS